MANPNKQLSPDIIESQPANENLPEQKPSPLRTYFLLFILISVLVSLAAYTVWQELNTIKSTSELAQSDLQTQLRQLDQATQSQLQSMQDQQTALNEQLEQTITISQQAINTTNRNQREWVLAEVEYLLRIANRRLQIARDINGAIAALTAANQRLFDLGDLTYFELRKQLNNDIASLKSVYQVDINGTALAIDQIISLVNVLPFKSAQDEIKSQLSEQNVETTTEEPEGFVDKVIDTVMNIGDIKFHQRSIQPASSAQQQQHIEQLLISHLLSARLSVLRYDNTQFNHDIQKSIELLNLYYKDNDNRVTQINNDLLEFKNINLLPDLPDITHSWNMLKQPSIPANEAPSNTPTPANETSTTLEVL
ncbi:MAG: uroporphyrinogen-III C-methyltransferase [Gammaproteobacteria bacterium]|nr:uroporphyrinogen-III C-methyltransferase [Gammaproteobacteria bacterium]